MRRLQKLFLSILILSAAVLFLACDSSVGEKTYGGSRNQNAYDVKSTSDGGCIVTGVSATSNNSMYDFYTFKIDSLGEVEWSKTAGGAGADWAYGVAIADDGGYVVAGDTQSFGPGDPENYGSYGNAWFIKYNSNGKKVKEVIHGYELREAAMDIESTKDGGFIAAGFTHTYGNGDFLVIKLDSELNVTWDKNIGFDNSTEVGQTIKETNDGGYIVAGTSYKDSLIVKLDAGGNVIWSTIYGAENDIFDSIKDITLAEDGYIAVGYTTTDVFPNNDSEALAVKIGEDGIIVWDKTYGGSEKDIANSIVKVSNGYVFAGETGSFGNGTNRVSDSWIVKIDENGNESWSKTHGPSEHNLAKAIDVISTGFVVAGDIMTGTISGYDISISKLNSKGEK